MKVLSIISPARIMRVIAGDMTAGAMVRHRVLGELNDHYLRDIGLRRERPGPPERDPWML